MERQYLSMRILDSSISTGLALWLAAACLAVPCQAQQLVPRRWSHLPVGVNFAGGGYAFTKADITFDPVLQIEDAGMDMHAFPFKYIRTFEFAGKSARVDLRQSYLDAQWSGLLEGVPTTVDRSGWSDTDLRFAVNVLGAPPLSGAEFKKYRAETDRETIVGVGLVVQVPTGHYLEDKLLNLGSNRFTFRPQLGIVHTEGKWSTEATLSSWFYTDNDEFFDGNYLEQQPFYTIQGHVDYTFRPGLWAGAGIGCGLGGESSVNGVHKDDQRENLAWVLSFGYPITPKWGIKFAYIGSRTLTSVGADWDSFAAAVSVLW
jgi:hypothetical protein